MRDQAAQASSAAEVRKCFAARCDSLQKREISLKPAARGFKEETKHHMDMGTYKRTTTHVYSFVFVSGGAGMVKVK